MLILNTQDIQSCQLAYNNSSLDKFFSGISYQNLVFIPVTSFAHIDLKKAENVCRQFLRQQNPLTSIIIKEESKISVWVEAPDYKLIESQIEKILKLEKQNPNQPNWIS